jgi:anti-anti-sigma factor
MDSTGIGALIDLAREADDHGKTFAIEEPSQRVLRILTLTGLQDAWTAQSAPEG